MSQSTHAPGARRGLFITLPFTLVTIIALTLLSGCAAQTGSQQVRSTVVEALARGDDPTYARPTEPIDFQFPRDHGAHEEYRTEWWYYTGNLAAENGDEFGYQLTFFRSALSSEAVARDSDLAANQIYMAHFAVTDVKAETHFSIDRYSRAGGGLAGATGEPYFEVWLDDWSVVEREPGVQQLQAATAPGEGDGQRVAINLTLRETRPPVLHGDRGLSQKGPETGNANYYYSLVGLASDGVVTIDGRETPVTGLSWMDHEFGTSALSGDTRGWDWFSVQLDNGAILMFGEFHDGQGENRSVYEGSFVTPDGEHFSLGPGDFVLRKVNEWTSPDTGVTYPAGWTVEIPAHATALSIEPLIADQEMDVDFIYYEGATRIEGEMGGAAVSGRGFVELTGYGDRQMAEFQR